MNFYDTKNRPSNADYLAEIEQAEKRRTPEERERRAEAEEKRRLRNAGARIELSCSQAQHEKIKFIIWQVPIVEYVPETGKLVWHGYEYHFEKKILDAMSEDKQFCKAVLSVKPQIERHIKKNAEKAAEINKEAAASQALIKEELESLQAEQGARRNNQVILRENKNKPSRIFLDEEKAKLIDVQAYSEEDLNRSLENILKKKAETLGKIKSHQKNITTLETELVPFAEAIAQLQEKLNNDDLSETDFKDLKLSLEYRQIKASKIQGKISKQLKQISELETELQKKIDYKQSALNLAIDNNTLQRDFRNWQNRRQRVIERNQKLMREFTGLETLKQNLDEKWEALTGDTENLCPPLLRTDRKIFII